MNDYTTINNPYDEFINRSIENDPFENPDQPIREGGQVKDVWITTFIRSVNWRPVYSGFNIDGSTGIGEFQKLKAREVKILANDTSGQNGGIFQYYDSSTVTFNIRPDGRVLLTPINGSADVIAVTLPSTGSDMSGTGGMINLEALNGNYSKKGMKINIDGGTSVNPSIGIEFIVNAGSSTSYALYFPTSPTNAVIVNAAVGGSQDYKIRIKIGSTTYFIPCYTA